MANIPDRAAKSYCVSYIALCDSRGNADHIVTIEYPSRTARLLMWLMWGIDYPGQESELEFFINKLIQ